MYPEEERHISRPEDSVEDYLKNQIPSGSLEYLSPYGRRPLSKLADDAARALSMDMLAGWAGPGSTAELDAILKTGAFIRQVNWGITRTDNFNLQILPRPYSYANSDEGLFTADVSSLTVETDKTRKTRLFEIGFVVTGEGDLLISRLQRHLLGQAFRKNTLLFAEKKRGDAYYREFRRKTGMRAESFGLACAVMAFGTHIPSGIIKLPLFHEQPSVKEKLVRWEHLRDKRMLKTYADGIEVSIGRLRRVADFQAILSEIGIPNGALTIRDKFIGVASRELSDAVQNKFAQNRKEKALFYRNALMDLAEMQKRK